MHQLPNARRTSLPQWGRFFFLVSCLLVIPGCSLFGTHKKIQVPQLLTPLAEADKNQLLREVNRLAAIKSIHGKVDILFEDNSFADVGLADKYKQADGTITLQKPGAVYLVIQVPFIAKDIAQMTSDGQHFRVAVLEGDEKYRRFVKGTNSAVYEKMDLNGTASGPSKDGKKKTTKEKEAVSALSNLRPQHLTEALIISPVAEPPEAGVTYSRSEFYQDELDNSRQPNKSGRVIRGYYLLEELMQTGDGENRLRRRFWFDRVGTIRLARLQTFDEHGLLVADVSYLDEKPVGEGGRTMPTRIEITRPHDRYKLSIAYQNPAEVVVDKEYRPEAFVLENKWQLPEVDLDAERTKKVTANH
jgi:hypothetical protein